MISFAESYTSQRALQSHNLSSQNRINGDFMGLNSLVF